MNYKPPLHVINKEKERPVAKISPQEHSEAYKIEVYTLSYRIKGMIIGLAVALFYCYYYLHHWSELYIFGGLVLGFALGWLVGRFFYSSSRH